MGDKRKTDDERLAKAIEAFRFGMQVPDPAAALSMLMEAKRRKTPGDPFNATIDQLVAYTFQNPQALSSTDPGDYLKSYMRIVSEHVKTMIAEKLSNPSLEDSRTLGIEIDDDWRINAFVEEQPPYSIYVSTNLFLFCARVSELLIAGMGMKVVDDSLKPQYTADVPYSREEVAREIRGVLESFHTNRTIPKSDVHLKAAHYTFHQIVFHSIMALIVCHEFGHVVIHETRRAGEPIPFADRARGQIEANATNLKLGPAELREVVSPWENEITADLLGVSLAGEYVAERGPWKKKPGIRQIARMSFHLCFIAQCCLYRFLSQRRLDFSLVSKTHPPIDFRMHCASELMYGRPAELGRPAIPYGKHEDYLAITEYAQAVVNRVF